MIRDIFQMAVHPAVVLKQGLDSRPRGVFSVLALFASFVVEIVKWSLCVVLIGYLGWMSYDRLGDLLGLVPQPVLIAGTGSMYPTFPKGQGATPQEREKEDVAAPLMYRYPGGIVFNGTRYFGHTLKHGDIISFSNAKTFEAIEESGGDTDETTGFVKRVIALAGDRIEIRDGFVRLNGQILEEPYTADARSTFGGTYLPDCQPLTVPEGKLLAFGDNRKGSNDSRNTIGLVDIVDVDRYLPLEKQSQYQATWRDTSKDAEQANKTVLDTDFYLDALNKIREEHDLQPLKYDQRLEASARARAQNMLRYNDLSFEATRSGYTASKAMSEAGYTNIAWGEAPTLGYYTAEELLENYAQSEAWQKFLLDETYDDTGIAAVIGNLNGCPVQIVVQHVAGYVPPNYKQTDIDSWKALRENLQQVLPSWEDARGFGGQYEENKADYERIISILHERISISNILIARMEANQWFTPEEKRLIEKDKALSEEHNTIANRMSDQ